MEALAGFLAESQDNWLALRHWLWYMIIIQVLLLLTYLVRKDQAVLSDIVPALRQRNPPVMAYSLSDVLRHDGERYTPSMGLNFGLIPLLVMLFGPWPSSSSVCEDRGWVCWPLSWIRLIFSKTSKSWTWGYVGFVAVLFVLFQLTLW